MDTNGERQFLSFGKIIVQLWPIFAILFTAGVVYATIQASNNDVCTLRTELGVLKEEVAVLKANAQYTRDQLTSMSADIKLLLQRVR